MQKPGEQSHGQRQKNARSRESQSLFRIVSIDRKSLQHLRPALSIKQSVQIKTGLSQRGKIRNMLVREPSKQGNHSHGADAVCRHCKKSSGHSRLSHQIRQKKTDQNQRTDRDKIKLNSCSQEPGCAPAGHGRRTLHLRPAQPQIQTGENQPLRAQGHVHRHLGKHDGRDDEKQAAYSRLRPFPHIMKNQKGSEGSLQRKTQKPPQSEILKLLRKNSPEKLEEHRQKRHRVRKNHRDLIRPGHPVHQTNGKGPAAVPKETPAKIVLRQVSAAKQPVRIGDIQHMYTVNTQECRDSDRHPQQPDHILGKPGRNAIFLQLPHCLRYSFHPDARCLCLRPPVQKLMKV